MNIKSKLIRKQYISDGSYKELFEYLCLHYMISKSGYYKLLKPQLVGRYSRGYMELNIRNSGNNKCWFINSGMIIGFQKRKNKKAVILLFKAGEMAILPDSFFYGKTPICRFIACPDTHLLEISNGTAQRLANFFPEAREISNRIICSSMANLVERSELLDLRGKEAIIEFHSRYPETKGPDKKVKLLDAYQASYLGMTKTTFSKLLKQIYSDKR